MIATDFGCGTGLLTLALQPYVERIIGVDSSPAMLAKLQEKVATGGFEGVETRLLAAEDASADGSLGRCDHQRDDLASHRGPPQTAANA